MTLSLMAALAEVRGVSPTMGAILVGSLISVFFSGIVAMQVFVYYRIYPKDRFIFKSLVGLIWILDLVHTGLVCGANWFYLVANFGNLDSTDVIPGTVAVTIVLTAIITWLVHMFFSHRILTLSKSIYITAPVAILATFRLCAAIVSTSEMIRIGHYTGFVNNFAWVFTMGLASAAIVDVAIAAVLCYYLNRSRTGFTSMDGIIDSITLYTVENGMLTCITTIISLICWITMPHNLIFLALHFGISKLYANAFMATLNARKVLRGKSQGSSDRNHHSLPILFSSEGGESRSGRFGGSRGIGISSSRGEPITTKVQINVETTIQEDDREHSEASASVTPSDIKLDTRTDSDRDTKSVGYIAAI
ncbi:hypothetical protein C8Q75DRAFT_156143 [Abortiporus biennis]|nr:hypothetical protein C8Q75DRAFT_156143 [Abortiporus biennis]